MGTVIAGIVCFALGTVFGLLIAALFNDSSQGNDRIKELRFDMCREMDKYLEDFKKSNGSAHDRAIANDVAVVAKNIIKTTVD